MHRQISLYIQSQRWCCHTQAGLTVTYRVSTKMTLDVHYHNRVITHVFLILLQTWSVCDTVKLSQTVSPFPYTHTHTQTLSKSVALCRCLLWPFWLSLSTVAAPLIPLHHAFLAHFATKVIIIIVVVFVWKLAQNHHFALLQEISAPGGAHIQTSSLTQTHMRGGGSSLQLHLKSPAPSKGKACLSLIWVIMGLSDRGRLTLSGQAECTSFRPGRSGWHRGLGYVPHVGGLASPAAISVPLCSQSH